MQSNGEHFPSAIVRSASLPLGSDPEVDAAKRIIVGPAPKVTSLSAAMRAPHDPTIRPPINPSGER